MLEIEQPVDHRFELDHHDSASRSDSLERHLDPVQRALVFDEGIDFGESVLKVSA